MNIIEYRAQFTAYHSSLALARYQHQVGSAPGFRLDRLRADYGDLFSRSALTDLESQANETRTEDLAAGLRGLLSAARLEHIQIQANEVGRELSVCESSIHFAGSTEAESAQSISFRLANEPSWAKRDQLARRWADAVPRCDDLRTARLHLLREAADAIGFGSYGDLIAEATRTNLTQLQLSAEGLLKETEVVHRLALARLVTRELPDAPAGERSFADLAYLEQRPWLDKYFAAKNWSAIYAETMSLLGIRVDRQPNVQIVFANQSAQDRPAECFPVKPPADVRLVLSPRRTADDFARNLHAAGLAQQHAWCSRNLADTHPEFIYSPDSATSEGYGYLLAFLLLDPKWTQEFLAPISETQASELARDVAAVLALKVRRLAAETSYAMLLHAAIPSSPEQLQSAFVDLLTEATGFQFRPELFLLELHERIDCAGQLRALVFAAGLREYLRGRYGNRWWSSRKAGDELIDLWNTASRYSVEELARLNGFEIGFELLTELLIRNVSGAKK